MRLDAYLSGKGFSRSEAQRLIQERRVTVNGTVQNRPAFGVTKKDLVAVGGEEVWQEDWIYLALNKPADYVCTTDPGPDCVLNLVPRRYRLQGLAPVGRLDKETTGLLLLSNDGDFIHRMISPKKHVQKEYIAFLRDPLTDRQISLFHSGIVLSDGTVCLPAEIKQIDEKAASVILTEGKYHQVRRMFAAAGNFVLALQRVRIGGLRLDGIDEGETLLISPDRLSEDCG